MENTQHPTVTKQFVDHVFNPKKIGIESKVFSRMSDGSVTVQKIDKDNIPGLINPADENDLKRLRSLEMEAATKEKMVSQSGETKE